MFDFDFDEIDEDEILNDVFGVDNAINESYLNISAEVNSPVVHDKAERCSSKLNNPVVQKTVIGDHTPSRKAHVLKVVDSNQIPGHNISPFSVHSSHKTKRRKFPGPAGLLPERRNSSILTINEDSLVEDEPHVTEVTSEGTASQSILEDEPWQRLLAELETRPPGREVLDCLNVASVKRKAGARLLAGHKVPFLAAVIHEIDCSSPDPFVTLRDPTGEMSGTLHRDVWQNFGDDLIVGSVLVLINVGVLSVGSSPRRHYLNITGNNVATIYSARQNSDRTTRLKHLTSEDFIKTIDDWHSTIKLQTEQSSSVCSNRSPLFSFSPSSSLNGVSENPSSRVSLFTSSVKASTSNRASVNINNSNCRRDTETVTRLLFDDKLGKKQVNGDCSFNNMKTFQVKENAINNNIRNNNCTAGSKNLHKAQAFQHNQQKFDASTTPSKKKDIFSLQTFPHSTSGYKCHNNVNLLNNNCNKKLVCNTSYKMPENSTKSNNKQSGMKSLFQPKSPNTDVSQDMFMSPVPCDSSRNNVSMSSHNATAGKSSQTCSSSNKVFVSSCDELEKSQVDIVLEGIDADSFFDEDF